LLGLGIERESSRDLTIDCVFGARGQLLPLTTIAIDCVGEVSEIHDSPLVEPDEPLL
jgi:hypothetical protein